MKIKFLGTSAGWPLPRLGCKCQICTSKDPKDTRTRTQILVNDSILLDAGPDTYNHLIKKNLSQSLTSILVTHEHPDHILGFQDLTHLYNFKNKITLFVTKPVLTAIKRIFPFPLNPVIVKVNGNILFIAVRTVLRQQCQSRVLPSNSRQNSSFW